VHMLTFEAELHGIELDGHGAGAGAGGDRQLLVIGVVDTWTAMSHAVGARWRWQQTLRRWRKSSRVRVRQQGRVCGGWRRGGVGRRGVACWRGERRECPGEGIRLPGIWSGIANVTRHWCAS
jgi:hypothetical protein